MRWLLTVVAVVGVAATIRFAVAPPEPVLPPAPKVPRVDLGAQGFAEAFARSYLTYDARDPELHQRGLAAFVGESGDPDAGFSPPNSGSQQVHDARVVQARPAGTGGETYTVAVLTDRRELLHLTVTVRRTGLGALQLVGDPALVGPPVSERPSTSDLDSTQAVTDPAIEEVVERALRNYLGGNVDDLRADMAPESVVTLPGRRLGLRELSSVSWTPSHASVYASVSASDENGGLYQLTYELDIDVSGGRPFVTAIQTNPYS